MNAQRGRHHKPVTLAGLQIADRTGDIEDAIAAAKALHARDDRPRPIKSQPRKTRWWGRFVWNVEDECTGEVYGSGWRFTSGQAWAASQRVIVRVLNRRAES